MHKLGVIVPYRDRKSQLEAFVPYITDYLTKQEISFELFVIEQKNDKPFNRGACLNRGFLLAENAGCDYVAFHDIDMLPLEGTDYSYPEEGPLQLANQFYTSYNWSRSKDQTRIIPDDYFGGVTLFTVEYFKKVGGYSNQYAGWGYEDNDLLLRCVRAKIPLDKKTYRQPSSEGKGKLFEKDYIEVQNPYLPSRPVSIYVDFRAFIPNIDEKEIIDEGCIFSIPGLDTNICYDSFGTYKVETFDNYEESYSVRTEKLPPMHGKIILIIDPRTSTFSFYFNGILIEKKSLIEGRRFNRVLASKTAYLGAGNPNREKNPKWFNGQMFEYASFRRELSKEEIKKLQDDGYDPDMDAFEYLDFRETGTYIAPEEATIFIPKRRPGKFYSQEKQIDHWSDWNTRKNYMRYLEVQKLGTQYEKDGLNNVPRTIYQQIYN